MDNLDALLITNIIKKILCPKERGRLSTLSKIWRESVAGEWTNVTLVELRSVQWLADQVKREVPGRITSLVLAFRGKRPFGNPATLMMVVDISPVEEPHPQELTWHRSLGLRRRG
jgi:hypothetical protein